MGSEQNTGMIAGEAIAHLAEMDRQSRSKPWRLRSTISSLLKGFRCKYEGIHPHCQAPPTSVPIDVADEACIHLIEEVMDLRERVAKLEGTK